MKVKHFTGIVLLGMILLLGIASCEELLAALQDMPDPRESDVTLLQERLFRVDSTGTIVSERPNIGTALYETTPTVYYVGVSSLEEAKSEFLSFVDRQIIRTESDDNITLTIRDEALETVTTITFEAFSNPQDGILAEVVFPEILQMPGLSKLVFMDARRWPTNGSSPYRLWKAVKVPDSNHANPTGLCVREWSPGTNGIILALTTDWTNRDHMVSNTCGSTMAVMHDYLATLNRWDEIDNMLRALNLNTLDNEYWENDKVNHGLWVNRYTYNMKTGKQNRHSSGGNGYNFLAYYFDEGGNCW